MLVPLERMADAAGLKASPKASVKSKKTKKKK
jgi:hypothetical protein